MLAILAAVMLAAAPQNDTVYLADGGRIVGTVIEEGPQGITVQMPDGTTRKLARGEVRRIEYRDGSVSTPNRPPPPPPQQQAQPPAYRPPPAPPPAAPPYAPPPPAYRPPPPPYGGNPPPYAAPPHGPPALMPFWLSFGIGGSFPSGEAAGGIPMDTYFSSQLGLLFEGGARLTPHLGLGVYLDLGIGDPSSQFRAACGSGAFPTTCTATTGRVGPLLRFTFQPYASSTPWLAVGTGWEWGDITYDDTNQKFVGYSGWEMLRLMAGVDLRTSPVFGIGLYGGVSFGRYMSYDEPGAGLAYDVADQRTHTTFEAGLRFTLFP